MRMGSLEPIRTLALATPARATRAAPLTSPLAATGRRRYPDPRPCRLSCAYPPCPRPRLPGGRAGCPRAPGPTEKPHSRESHPCHFPLGAAPAPRAPPAATATASSQGPSAAHRPRAGAPAARSGGDAAACIEKHRLQSPLTGAERHQPLPSSPAAFIRPKAQRGTRPARSLAATCAPAPQSTAWHSCIPSGAPRCGPS
jgi:hypothetical protein